jgi:hypothetical protein
MMKIKGTILVVAVLLLSLGNTKEALAAADHYGDKLESIYSYIGSELKDRSSEITVEVDSFKGTDILKLVGSRGLQTYETSNHINYDYEIYNVTGIKYIAKQTNRNNKTVVEVKLYPSYRENKEQTDYVYQKVNEILNSHGELKNYTDAQKYSWIYDYIISNVSYDYSMQNQSAYAALKNGSTICDGYASLFYAFATELGLPCRIAYETASGIYHAWNLVKLNDEWYCADATMGDAPGARDTYILTSMYTISTHDIEAGFRSEFVLASANYSSK